MGIGVKQRMLATVLLLLLLVAGVASYRILVAPVTSGFNSRMLNMQKMADMLAQDGHQVDVIMNNRVKDHVIVKHARVVNFQVPDNVSDVTSISVADFNMRGWKFFRAMRKMTSTQIEFCNCLFQHDDVMKQLRHADYDLLLADMLSLCSGVLASHLNATTILYQNFGFYPDSSLMYPIFPSFSCQLGSVCSSDDMAFFQRVLNTFFLAVSNYYIIPGIISSQYEVAKKNDIELKIPLENVQTDRIILLNNDYILDAPRPTMPHVFPISGLFHRKALPLSAEFQKIVDLSGASGVILISFGTLVPKFDVETAEKFANVFGNLKQQVIWRYTGEKPKGLKNNTHLTNWFPQNDLLANPATKLFITHCGISSTFESIYNGVPVIAMPLVGDQLRNAFKLTDRAKVGVRINYYSFTEKQLERGINELLSNPFYRDNAKKASLTMSDQVAPPVQQFRHLVNFTIKTGGAKHLFHPYAGKMSWFTYFAVDVLLFIFSVFSALVLTFYTILRAIYKYCFKKESMSEKMKKQ